ncbi:hypothetical protein FOXG_01465 [Fusarium oxysporum f. sp. lycopersici 4287]|uniref:Eisosome protein 1 n=2 Tax=Fusarium oxysporum TaxID=5507 RepID=A0A0J9UA57_FUSO4|nr:hypothetical protein FOXG_01465 [Fusarium oxysporum f. sp. lycopersici 4287]KAJ0148091.1 Uncharacterized protein HZ326_9334 [Fusarium oxysporum f. sp. albedinis]KAJ9424758.1 hypothetical protein QL093DRAFT_2222527 [Fusarium oxysporum]KAK2480939.1 hypothetical protein H9L39_06578 [Fusarium oxysporum f. sp. albedinis]KNA96163.1 hypothetical protein FOXG_01465 [Fusarium oxysporum f. sp. lycopersici 4287]
MPTSTSQQPTMIQSQPAAATVANNSGRLKYADPRDLPSYPSAGLRPDGAAASAAASLGWSNQKTIELWKPDKTSSASAAAALAKDYKMAPAWEPTSNSAGHKAALLAVGSANAALNQSPSQRKSHEGWGNSAATQAFNTNRANSMRQPDPRASDTSLQGQKSLAAAKGAMSTTRRRAKSTPSAPDSHAPSSPKTNTRPDALSGAALAHKASLRAKPATENAGAVPVTTMTRNMFTSNPPVKPEVDERQNNEQLHASAVAMARKMYSHQQKIIDEAKETHGQGSDAPQPKPYINLQDAAYKQAQERLAKLEQEHQKNRDYQSYYGNESSPRRRFTLTSKLRRRSSSDGDLDDRQQSERIRQQMSLFSNKLSEVDQKKRQDDRNALLAAAQRNVKARLQGMDEKVYHETGQVNPTLMSEWELKAHQLASASHETRNANKGKIDIGGGRFMDPHDIDAIAAKRMQPLLDDINEKAEVERERLATLKMEEEARKAEQEKQKARDRETKEITKKLKDQEKQEYKAKKAEEKAARAEERRQAKEEKQRSRGNTAVSGEEAIDDGASTRSEEAVSPPIVAPNESSEPSAPAAIDTEAGTTERGRRKLSDAASPTSKVKGWIKNRFSRGKSLGEKDRENQGDKRSSFIGGAALRDTDANESSTSLDNRATSMRDVALAGRSANAESSDHDRDVLHDSRGISPVSSLSEDEAVPAITPPPAIKDPAERKSQSPSRDSRFREMMDN